MDRRRSRPCRLCGEVAEMTPCETYEQYGVRSWVNELMDAAIAALTPYTVVYSYDYGRSHWAEEAWTVSGEEPTLRGYVGGPLVVQSSHDPRPTGLPTAGVEVKNTPEPYHILDCHITVKETLADDLHTLSVRRGRT